MSIEINIKSDDVGDEFISAFSFNTGNVIEEIIKKQTNNLAEENNMLKSKILFFYNGMLESEIKLEFAEYFGIKEDKLR